MMEEPTSNAFSTGDLHSDDDFLTTTSSLRRGSGRATLITGGAGFIGTNLADALLSSGQKILILDDLSRDGVENNLRWLRRKHGQLLEFKQGDVRDNKLVFALVQRSIKVFHLAAQVAVTTSLVDPIGDFEVNARGTLNVLEAVRAQTVPPPLVFTSTNKVYGDLEDVGVTEIGGRYLPINKSLQRSGIGDTRPINFHSPYGCSKGSADQYVLDYARTFGIPAVVFRMSCIFGPHQCGNEDQGWIAHFLLRAMAGLPITIYGDGRQVRDVLFVDDLVKAFRLAVENIDRLAGRAFNIGGGPTNAVSLIDVLEEIEHLSGRNIRVEFDDWRAADQRYYVSDTRSFKRATGWTPAVTAKRGIAKLHAWYTANRKYVKQLVLKDPVAAAASGRSELSLVGVER
jgi:CDP-paratose 2-epimerase